MQLNKVNEPTSVGVRPMMLVRTAASKLSNAVSTLVADESFRNKHKKKLVPVAMLAFAQELMETIDWPKDNDIFQTYFVGLTIVVPPCHGNNDPHHHSIVSQKLLLVDWTKTHVIEVSCPDSKCIGCLSNGRTKFSKNKTLFPILGLDGAPAWCVVMSVQCHKCHIRFDANDAEVLLTLPEFAAASYPVETKCALSNNNFHLNENTTQVFDAVVLTYGNGEI